MSSRVLRDDLWTSETINSLHDKTFRLYLCLINAADDFGLVDTSFGALPDTSIERNKTSEISATSLNAK